MVVPSISQEATRVYKPSKITAYDICKLRNSIKERSKRNSSKVGKGKSKK
jgi:hypothetical protein